MATWSKWAFLEDDPDLDEEGEASFSQAKELREQANALAHHAQSKECLAQAVTMYCRADELLKENNFNKQAVEVALQCRLNAACLALQVASMPLGAAGQKQVEQAAETAHRLAHAALKLDQKNPHAALVLARLGADQRNANAARQWLSAASQWAKERNEKDVQNQVAQLEKKLNPEPTSWGQEVPDWVRLGVALLKQSKPAEAEKLFTRAIEFLDQKEQGGPIEVLSAQALRSLGFDALEGLGDCLAAKRDFAGALRSQRRAAALLKAPPGTQVPFKEPEFSRREGLLHLSMGHAAEASQEESLPLFRRAAQALQRPGTDAALEGTAVLELGLRLEAADESDLAVPALERALECFKLAQGRLHAGGGDEPEEAKFQRRQLQAQAALCSLHQMRGDRAAVEETLDASRHLLSVPTEVATASALEWAKLCGEWAFGAAKAGRLADAEEALLQKWRLAGGKDSETQDDKVSSELDARCLNLQREALQSLALVRQKVQNQAGVEDAMARLSHAPGAQEDVEKMQQHLRRAPQGRDCKAPSDRSLTEQVQKFACRGAGLAAVAALGVVLAYCATPTPQA
ncbi:unnamed protein product [Effrenium voratum]|uniref:Uncharacterized protein n=1 Tax=Effrenium voratum TaxID=2562239 RepID=A0AA36MI17_9DINO|nr:unnamed protein product [Effrenium voratum]CAJ1437194.1 unnamed protein product [Effrenium voratum]